MPLYEPILPSRYLALLLPLLEAPERAWLETQLAEQGLSVARLAEPGNRVTMAAFERMLAGLAQRTGRTDLGFGLGLGMRPDDHGPLVPLMRRCTTLEQVFQVVMRYFRLMSPIFSISFQRYADRGELVYRPAAPMAADIMVMMMEVYVVSVHPYLRATLGERLPPYDVYLSIAAPAHVRRYGELKPARFHFCDGSLPQARVVLPDATLKLPLRWQDAPGAMQEVPDLDTLLADIGRAGDCSGWIRLMLEAAEGYQPTIADFATLLNVSTRTLARTLEQEGTSLRMLAKEVRHQRACALLRDPLQPVSQIAYRLGYSDVANFSHAFKAEAGCSPRAWRQGGIQPLAFEPS
ncbi:AraC family transcriptional regulator ligand-binding domain-containing protein [Duganella sp. FT3S]|uniref:AraC family transcriptional regulator ligand-binding domain-containing protein n=1 Tax=Rugamonas fusca TaxID=2758568 RepID=A0A7W2EL02_9BURK|nr:AraC family transcriptional regulator [Rugamonas fusca]MBA5607705.1 AraC family transcriptional regulator ligand-binding domain-containing protein [Rugamonas fusca]